MKRETTALESLMVAVVFLVDFAVKAAPYVLGALAIGWVLALVIGGPVK